MSTPVIYPIPRGSTVSLFVEAVSGDPTTATSPVAKAKPVSSPLSPAPDSTVAAVLTITPVAAAASGDVGPGWTITLTAIQTAGLAAGFYMLDFACTAAGAEIVIAPVLLQVTNAISVP